MRVRLSRVWFGVPVVGLVLACLVYVFAGAPVKADVAGPSCGDQVVQSNKGLKVRILFAKNGAVQRYVVANSRLNMEDANDAIKVLIGRYGPPGVNAPPLQIKSFKAASGGLQIPDKAVDSCGRTLSFQ